MIGVFKQKSPGNVAVLFIFGLLLKLPLFLHPKEVVTTINDGQLYQWMAAGMPKGNSMVCSVIAFALLYGQALMINYLVNEFRMIAKQNFLPAMAYLLATSLLPEWNYLSSPMVSNTLIIWMFIYLFLL